MLLLSKSLAGGATQQTGPSRHIDIPPERMMKRWDVLGTLQTAFRYHDILFPSYPQNRLHGSVRAQPWAGPQLHGGAVPTVLLP